MALPPSTSSALLWALLAAACSPSEPSELPGAEPEAAARAGSDSLPQEPQDEDALPADVRERIDADLEMLFGTFEDPRYERLDIWGAAGFDPAIDAYGSADPDAARAAFAESARLRFGFELEHVRAGRFEDVHLPEYALDLLLAVRARAAELSPEARDGAARAEVEARIVAWYPTLAEASRIYRVHCASCHGARGAGDGPTAQTHDPRPRDLTSGIFKFTSRLSRAKPTRADLLRVLLEGLNGTGMASFAGLSRAELEGAIDWVRWLALRAAVEREMLATYELEGELPDSAAHEAYASAWESWLAADSRPVPVPSVVPQPTPERIARGRELFLDVKKGNCAQCHGEGGRGDGPASYTLGPDGARVSIVDEWGHPIRPRDLVEGKFRGGRTPVDVFRRIYAGINGTPMPGLGDVRDASGAPLCSDDELWDLAFYALSLRE